MTCLIFDLDGTLVDSESLCNQAFLNLLPELSDSLETLTHQNRGKKLSKIFKDLEIQLDSKLPDDFEVTYRSEVAQLFNQHLKPIKGAVEALSNLTNPKCIASNGPPKKINQSLQLTGLTKFFGDNIFSSYEVMSWKPDPELFLHAARQMNTSPSQCIVIEDSDVGIKAASAAGMKSILYNPIGDDTETLSITSMSELVELIAKISS